MRCLPLGLCLQGMLEPPRPLACGHPSVVPISALQKVRPLTKGHWVEQSAAPRCFWGCGLGRLFQQEGAVSLAVSPRPAHCCLCRPSSPLPKAPDPPLLLLSCFPACVQKWRELLPAPLSPPLTGGVGAAPLFPWNSEKQTNAQGGWHLSPLPPRTLLSSTGFSSPTWGP